MKYQKPSVQCHVCERFPVLSATAEVSDDTELKYYYYVLYFEND